MTFIYDIIMPFTYYHQAAVQFRYDMRGGHGEWGINVPYVREVYCG